MKQLGSAPSAVMEARIREETCHFLGAIAADPSPASVGVNPAPLLNVAISNVICSIIMSTRFRYNDPKFARFMHLFDEVRREKSINKF